MAIKLLEKENARNVLMKVQIWRLSTSKMVCIRIEENN